MTLGELLLNLGILAFVLVSGLGTRALIRRRFTLPIAIVLVVGWVFLRTVPTAGHDLGLEMILGAAGAAFGVLAGGLMTVHRDRTGASLVTTAAASYAAVWVFVVGARIVFAYGSDHWFSGQIASFSRRQAITGTSAWTAAFVIMALAMVASRVAVTAVKATRAPRRLVGTVI